MGLFESIFGGLSGATTIIEYLGGPQIFALAKNMLMDVGLGMLVLLVYIYYPKLKSNQSNRIMQNLEDALNTYKE